MVLWVFDVLNAQAIVETLTVPTSQRHYVLVPHLHGCVSGKRAAEATAAV